MLKGGLVLIWELDMNLEPTLLDKGRFQIEMKQNRYFSSGCSVGWVQDSCQAPKLIPGHPLA